MLILYLFTGGSLAKVAYLSEVSRIRARHYSRSGSFIGPKASNSSDCVAIDNEAGKQVSL